MHIGNKTRAVTKWKKLIEVDEWTEQNFVLEESSAVGGGKYSFKYAPTLRMPLKAFGFDNISNVTYWIGSQGGKSTLSYALINYVVDRLAGSNIGFYLPNDALVSYTATNRIIPSIKRIPSNAKLMSETKINSKLKDNSKIIRLGGAVLRVMGAESATNRKSFPAQFIFMDEIAEFKQEHVLEIEERNKTFSSFGGKIVKLSTSLHNNDPIVLSHENAECQMEYYCRCPKCGKMHIDDFVENVVFPDEIEVPEHIEKEKDIEVFKNSYKARSSMYKCPKCDELWDTDMKKKAVEMGEWKAVRGNIHEDKSVSFRASSFVSYFVSIEDLARKWLEVQNATDDLKIKFYNGWLSKIYEPKIETMPQDEIWKLKSKIPCEIVPDNTIGLVGAIDVQKDHYYYIVMAVDEYMNKHIQEYGRIETAHEAEMLIARPRYKQNGEMINVEVWAKDSGYNANEVYNFCYDMNTLHEHISRDETIARIFERRGGEAINCIPIKGSSRSTSNSMAGMSQITTIEKDLEGKVFDDSLKLHVINTFFYADMSMKLIVDSIERVNAKSQNSNSLETRNQNSIESQIKNSLQIHSDMDGKIAESFTSEHKIQLPNGAYQYVPTKSHPFNHYWDCLKYANYLVDKLEIRHRELITKEVAFSTTIAQDNRQQRRRDRYRNDWRDSY